MGTTFSCLFSYVFACLTSLQEKIEISPRGARLAVIQFGSRVTKDVTFEESTEGDPLDLIQKIRSIKRLEGRKTNTALALKETKQYFDENQRFELLYMVNYDGYGHGENSRFRIPFFILVTSHVFPHSILSSGSEA